MASWGSLASNAYQGLASYPYLLLFPALAICVTVLAFNIMGDGLRDALDPRMRK
jgi:oligopeptide transport system permease protein